VPQNNAISRTGRGRPPTTEPDHVGGIALALFAERGFESTTLEDIAAAAGVGRRTLFRYFPSKNDLVWGDFDRVLERLRDELRATGADEPLMRAIGRAVVASNSYAQADLGDLRIRMTLITTVPALQGHAMLRYAAWRRVLAEFAAARLGVAPDDHVPETIGHAALGTSMAAFTTWVTHPELDLRATLEAGYALLAGGYAAL
jgi:mycofactocin system transcriptional regulator